MRRNAETGEFENENGVMLYHVLAEPVEPSRALSTRKQAGSPKRLVSKAVSPRRCVALPLAHGRCLTV